MRSLDSTPVPTLSSAVGVTSVTTESQSATKATRCVENELSTEIASQPPTMWPPTNKAWQAFNRSANHPSRTAACFARAIVEGAHNKTQWGLRAPLPALHSDLTVRRAKVIIYDTLHQLTAEGLGDASQSRNTAVREHIFAALRRDKRISTLLAGTESKRNRRASISARYRICTYVDLAVQLLREHNDQCRDVRTPCCAGDEPAKSSDERPRDGVAKPYRYINNAYKIYVDELARNGWNEDQIAEQVLWNRSFTTPKAFVTLPIPTQQLFEEFPIHYADLGRRYGQHERITFMLDWLETMKDLKERLEAPSFAGDDAATRNRRSDIINRTIKAKLITAIAPSSSDKCVQLQLDLDASLTEFCSILRQHFPTMHERDIYRAKTNAWAILVLQRLFTGAFSCTASSLGFSALYPLTDSLIDDIDIPQKWKRHFFVTFGKKIETGAPPVSDALRDDMPAAIRHVFQDIWRAFEMIESQWARETHPEVYASMCFLHQAQLDSKLQDLQEGEDPADYTREAFADFKSRVFEITARKGFGSILDDAYLAVGHLTPLQAAFAGHFGTITQFINDSMAIREDIETERHYTPLNLPWHVHQATPRGHADVAKKEPFDDVCNRAFHLVNWIFAQPQSATVVDDEDSALMFRSMKSYLQMKLLMGVARNATYHTPAFLAHMAQFAPFSLRFMKTLNDLQEQRFDTGDPAAEDKKTRLFKDLNTIIKEDLRQTIKQSDPLTKLLFARRIRALGSPRGR